MARLKETTKSNAPGKGRRRGLRKAHGYAEEYEISSDELSSPKETSQQNIADEITVRTTHAPSHNSSRPSTANSGTASERSRRRGASSLVNEEDIDMLNAINSIEADEPAGEGPALKKPKSAIKDTASSSRKGRSKYDNPDEMLTNPRAPLATTNLRVCIFVLVFSCQIFSLPFMLTHPTSLHTTYAFIRLYIYHSSY